MVTVTSAPGSPVPEMVGDGLFVEEPAAGAATAGATGATVSTVVDTGTEGDEVFPAGSVWVAANRCVPSGRAEPSVQDHVPSAATVVVHTG